MLYAGLRRTLPRAAAYGMQQTRCFSSIPIVDVSALLQPDSDTSSRKRAAAALHDAAVNVGFFYATNTGVPPDLCKDVLRLARQWFDLPEATKQQIYLSTDRHFRGYQGLGANVTRYDGGFARDWHEGLDFYAEAPVDTQPHSRIHGPNQWPHQLPAFEATTREYVHHMLRLGHLLMRGIGTGLGVHSFPGEPATADESYWCMRIINYPPLPAAEPATANSSGAFNGQSPAARQRHEEIDRSVQLSCGEHTDYGMLTIVNQQLGVTALQVKNAQGQWIDAEPIEGAFVCNIGDMLRVMSGGLYQPTPHRVINADGTKTRTSVAFFYEPAFEAVVQPAGELQRRDGENLGPVRYGQHLENKVFSNFEL